MLSILALAAPSCVQDADIEDGVDDSFPSGKADGGIDDDSPEAVGVLAYVNDPTVTASVLKSEAHVSSRVAKNITVHRDGPDAKTGTADDALFDKLSDLDAVPYVARPH